MNKKAVNLYRGNIEGFPVKTESQTDKLIQDIIERTTQTAINKADEVTVMQCMLNDPEFEIGTFDANNGLIGTHVPRADAMGIILDSMSSITGMSSVEAYNLGKDYEFTKRDASRFINIGKDFVGTYLQTGRKMVLTNNDPRGQAIVNLKATEAKQKKVPITDENGERQSKTVDVPEGIKLNVENKRNK